MKKTIYKIIFSITFLAIFFITRLNGLNDFVGIDNYSWLYRINLYPWVVIENLKGNTIPDKDLAYAGTISYHPGVTIMTFSGISTKIGKTLIRKYDPLYEDCPYLDSQCKYLDFELFIAKLPLLIIGSFLFLYRYKKSKKIIKF